MKNILILVALAVSMSVVSANAATIVNKDNSFAIPMGQGGSGADSKAKWSLPSISRSDAISTAVHAGLGVGLIRGVCAIANTTAGGYVSLYDTISIAGLTAATGGTGSYLASVSAKILVAGYDTQKVACEMFDRPVPYSAGLAWIASDTNVRATVIYDTIKLP